MIIILHGDDILKSRQELERIKKQSKEAELLILDGRKVDLTQVKQALEARAMFTASRLVIIENLFSGRKNKNQEEILGYLAKSPVEVDLVLWEEGGVSKTLLGKFPKSQILLFKPEPVLFKFLELIRPENTGEMLTLLTRCIGVEAPEIIFYMLVRQFRFLLLVKDGITSGVEELDRLADWQKERLSRQAKYFSQKQLVDIYHKLLEIDFCQKRGLAPFDLSKTLENFIISL